MTASDWSPTEARERADGIVALHGRGGDPSEETPWCDECVDNNGNAMDFPCPTLIEARDVIEALKEVTRVNDYIDGLTVDHASMTKRIAELESALRDALACHDCREYREMMAAKLRKAEEETERAKRAEASARLRDLEECARANREEAENERLRAGAGVQRERAEAAEALLRERG